MTNDYNAKLAQDYDLIRDRVRRGSLPLKARISAIESATNDYIAAQDADFERKKAKGGHIPIQLRNDALLHRLADLILYEDLTWSHPDKMSIIEYPVMSGNQQKLRHSREGLLSDVYTGKDDVTLGRSSDHDGKSRRIYDYMTPERDMALIPTEHLDLYTAIDSAGLTERQRQAIDLVYFDGLTQEDAGTEMGVNRHTVNEHLTIALRKIRETFVKTPNKRVVSR